MNVHSLSEDHPVKSRPFFLKAEKKGLLHNDLGLSHV